MTDRVHSLTIILNRTTRTDDVEGLVAAVSRMRGVSRVIITPSNHVEHTSEVALERARHELRQQIAGVLWPK